MTESTVAIGKGETPQAISLNLANRHGLIAGATGTGKTITLQVLAEGFARAGVPVFVADVKGDLSGLSRPGSGSEKLLARAHELGAEDYAPEASPVVFWDLFGEQGHPVRTTIAEMGPILLARLLELNDTQEGVLNVAFRAADDEGMLILDLEDLRSLLVHVAENADALTLTYGNVSKASVGAIQRRLLQLAQEGAEQFFGEPALDLEDLMQGDLSGRGVINVLMADKLMQSPRLYATFLLWLLSELFEQLPEVGDPDKPRLVFFFDEAHLLFDTAPSALIEKVEQVVRLIRSKGVGVYFVTQNPLDIPASVLDQLGNRVQHALRAFTPQQQKAVRAAAETFRANPAFQTGDAITNLAVGEALVSTLEKGGIPSVVERTKVLPPRSRMGPIDDAERQETMRNSPVRGRYDEAVNRESAVEILQQRAFEKALADAEVNSEAEQRRNQLERTPTSRSSRRIGGTHHNASVATGDSTSRRRTSSRQGVGEAFSKSIARSVGSQIGRALVRGVLGSLLKR